MMRYHPFNMGTAVQRVRQFAIELIIVCDFSPKQYLNRALQWNQVALHSSDQRRDEFKGMTTWPIALQ